MSKITAIVYISNEIKKEFASYASRKGYHHPVAALELINLGLASVRSEDYPKISQENSAQIRFNSSLEKDSFKSSVPKGFQKGGAFNNYLGLALTKGLELVNSIKEETFQVDRIREVRIDCLEERGVALLNLIYPKEITIIDDLTVSLKLINKRYQQLLELVDLHSSTIKINNDPDAGKFKLVDSRNNDIVLEKNGIKLLVTGGDNTIVMQTFVNMTEAQLHVLCRDALVYLIDTAGMLDD
jgi:hypothetical protein